MRTWVTFALPHKRVFLLHGDDDRSGEPLTIKTDYIVEEVNKYVYSSHNIGDERES